MKTSRVEYMGGLRTKCTHLRSGSEIITDAPLDNNGKGEAFSPTDLVATAYASCMMTIIGIFCNEHGLNFSHAVADVTKIMGTAPRRISEIVIELDMTQNGWNEEEKERVLRAGKACPVAKSVHENIVITFDIKL
jgi:uncharacterized OsmC-like protein